MIKGRAARWRKGTAELLAPLSDEQKEALRQARRGLPPAFVLGWTEVPDTGEALDPPLRAIEEIARAMLRTYEWPTAAEEGAWPRSGLWEALRGGWRPVGPDWIPDPNGIGLRQDRGHDRVYPMYDDEGRPIEGRPDFRLELLQLIELSAELRAALAGRYVESAALRAMTIGTLLGRVASMVLDGPLTAIGAATEMCKGEGHESLRDNLREKLGERDAAISELDRATQGLKGKSERAAHIKPKLDRWVTRYNRDRAPEDHVGTLSVDRISRMLPSRR